MKNSLNGCHILIPTAVYCQYGKVKYSTWDARCLVLDILYRNDSCRLLEAINGATPC